MKICFISSLYSGYGGSEELWIKTAGEALKKKMDVLVSIYNTGEIANPIKELKEAGAKIILRPNDGFLAKSVSGKIKSKLNKAVAFDSFSLIKKFSPDIILISQGGTYDFTWQKELADFILEFSSEKIFLLNQYNDEHKILDEGSIKLSRSIFKKASKVFFVSKRNLQICERQIAAEISDSVVIHNPIKTPIKKISFPPLDTIHFACVGRLDAEFKGQDVLLETLSSQEWRSRKWVLNIYGVGKDEKYLKTLSGFLQLDSKVIFHGFANNVTEIWEKNHFLILPSFGEGTPLVLLEAMACGRTAVVSDVGGCSEFIEDGYNGFIADAPTSRLLNNAIEKAWEKPEILEKYGERCLEKIKSEYLTSPETKLLNIILN